MSQRLIIHGPGCIYNTLKAEQLGRILRGEVTDNRDTRVGALSARAPHCQDVTVTANPDRFAVRFTTSDARFKTEFGDVLATSWFKDAGGHPVTCEFE